MRFTDPHVFQGDRSHAYVRLTTDGATLDIDNMNTGGIADYHPENKEGHPAIKGKVSGIQIQGTPFGWNGF